MSLHESSSIMGEMLELLEGWRDVFPSEGTYRRAVRLALAMCISPSRKTISNAIIHSGRDQQDWSADYKVFERSSWIEDRVFEPVRRYWLQDHIARGWAGKPLVAGIDTTSVKKTGKKIPHTQYYRDPMSPPFHVNLQWGQRLLNISALVARDGMEKGPARGIPVALRCCRRPSKPGRNATPLEKKGYEAALERCALSVIAVDAVKEQRKQVDKLGAEGQLLLMVGDGAFANAKIFTAGWDRAAWLCRTRKDMAVYYPSEGSPGKEGRKGRRRKYGRKAPTPEELRKDETVPWKETEVYLGENRCLVKYKSMSGILWKAARGAVVRILVINGLPYLVPGAKKKSYRRPAYLVYRGPDLPDEWLVQWYIWRPEVEVNIRDEKQVFGIGEAQVWSERSVPRCPAFLAATYGCLLVAAIRANGHRRGDFYLPLPKWNRRKPSQRPSTEEIVKKLRAEIVSDALPAHRHARTSVAACGPIFQGFVERGRVMRSRQKSLPDPAPPQIEPVTIA